MGRVLPDGKTWYSRTVRNSLGNVATDVGTYSVGTIVYQRTNLFAFATNDIDVITVTNVLGARVSSNYFNTYHQVLTNFNALAEKTVSTYDSGQRLTSVTAPTGLITTNIYFSSGYTNWLDRTIDFAVSGTNTTYYRTNAFTYANGLIYSQTDERGLTISNYWDNLQRLTGRLYPDSTFITNSYDRLDLVQVVDRLGYTNRYSYNAHREKTRETNALGVVTAYDYCQCGALDNVTYAVGITGLEQLTHFVYDNQGNRIETDFPDGTVLRNKYDSWGRITNVIDGFSSVTNYYNNQGLFLTASNAFGRVQSTTYDILDRTTDAVDANDVTITDTYDNLNRLLTRGYPDGGVEKFVYTLNVAGSTSYTNQPGSNVVNYAYDAMGRKTNEVYPGIVTNSYTYNAASDLLTLTDGKGQLTRWNYDQYGRATNKVDSAGTEVLRYQYDANNRLTNRWSVAKGSTAYSYDKVGNLTSVNYPVSPDL